MKDLMDMIIDGEQTFEYRLKFAFPPTDKQVERIERMLGKYDLMESTPIKRTIFQTNPIDFPELDAGEIWMLDVTLARGLQPTVALQEISQLISIPESLIRIRNMADPIQQYVAETEGDIEFDEEYNVKMLDPDYSEAEPVDHATTMGDELSGRVAKAATDHAKDNSVYTEYMVAGYEQMYQKAKADVSADAGPTKE